MSLPSSMADFVPCDRLLQKAYYGPSAKRAGHKSKGKQRGSVTYSTEREDEVSKIFISSLLGLWRVHADSEMLQNKNLK